MRTGSGPLRADGERRARHRPPRRGGVRRARGRHRRDAGAGDARPQRCRAHPAHRADPARAGDRAERAHALARRRLLAARGRSLLLVALVVPARVDGAMVTRRRLLGIALCGALVAAGAALWTLRPAGFAFADLWLTPDQQGRWQFERGDYARRRAALSRPDVEGCGLLSCARPRMRDAVVRAVGDRRGRLQPRRRAGAGRRARRRRSRRSTARSRRVRTGARRARTAISSPASSREAAEAGARTNRPASRTTSPTT